MGLFHEIYTNVFGLDIVSIYMNGTINMALPLNKKDANLGVKNLWDQLSLGLFPPFQIPHETLKSVLLIS